MRLLKTGDYPAEQRTLEYQDFSGDDIPPYAILSHTWDEDEVLYSDIVKKTVCERKGYWKLRSVLKEAFDHGLDFCWADNCCINKDSSAELSEAINSMFLWYQNAAVCYAYLADVSHELPEVEESLEFSRWFTRGWTLQELLAPKLLLFYSKFWQPLGHKNIYKSIIARTTSIDEKYIDGSWTLESASIAERMSWAASRQTTRPEDIAYSLMGIFSVNMPMMYGEGKRKAFLRLQEEIMKISVDQSIFAWTSPDISRHEQHGMLADSPRDFLRSRTFAGYDVIDENNAFTMTSLGLHISLRLQNLGDSIYAAALMCPHPHSTTSLLAVHLKKLPNGKNQFVRIHCGELFPGKENWTLQKCYIRQINIQLPSTHRDSNGFFQVSIRESSRSAQWSAVQIWSLSNEDSNDALVPTPINRMDHEIISDPPLIRLGRQDNALLVILGIESKSDGQRHALMLGCRLRDGALSPVVGVNIAPVKGSISTDELAENFIARTIRSKAITNIGDDSQLFIEVEERLKREGKVFLVDIMVRKGPMAAPNPEPVERGRRSIVSEFFRNINRSLSVRKHFR